MENSWLIASPIFGKILCRKEKMAAVSNIGSASTIIGTVGSLGGKLRKDGGKAAANMLNTEKPASSETRKCGSTENLQQICPTVDGH